MLKFKSSLTLVRKNAIIPKSSVSHCKNIYYCMRACRDKKYCKKSIAVLTTKKYCNTTCNKYYSTALLTTQTDSKTWELVLRF